MREIQVDLMLKFTVPETGLNINGVLQGEHLSPDC